MAMYDSEPLYESTKPFTDLDQTQLRKIGEYTVGVSGDQPNELYARIVAGSAKHTSVARLDTY